MKLRVVLDGRVIGERFRGIGRYVMCLATALARRDEIALTVLWCPSIASAPDLSAIGADLRVVDVAPFSLAEQTQLPGLARRLRPDVWHAPYFVMPYRRLPCATVVTLHDAAPLALPALWPWQRRLLFRLGHRLALRGADGLITVSEFARTDLEHRFGLDAGSITVTPLAAAPRFQPQPPSEQARVRRAYALPERFVLTVATDKPSKNLARLVAAFARLEAAGPIDYDCVIVGERGADHRGHGTSSRVHYLGVVPDADLAALYASTDLFIAPSLHEGFGLPVAEAMACGAPVACSHAASLPEVVGDAAVLFDPRDVDALAYAIDGTMADAPLRAELRVRGLRRAQALSWDEAAHRTLAVYRAACRA